jgi:ribosomal protein L11 methylase PrmA
MKNPNNSNFVPGSFRDPSGFLFQTDGLLYRQVNQSYQAHYDHLMSSGLYKKLADEGLLVEHTEVEKSSPLPQECYKVIKPRMLPFISYPYEWCFSQFKDAALLTLQLQRVALQHEMILKDASAYNVQFMDARPIFIDTLSFEKYHEDEPWVAYRQFCQHFLAPLALMAYTDIRLNQLLRVYMDGVPLDLAAALLPGKTKFQIGLLSHLHMHAKSQKHFAGKTGTTAKTARVSRLAMQGLIDHLLSTVQKLRWQPKGTEWADYYNDTNYSDRGLEEKKVLVKAFLANVQPNTVWDLGANTGVFSYVAAELQAETISFDIDPAAVEKNYRSCRARKQQRVLPLLLDLTNPSASIGWALEERQSLTERGPVDAVLALALIHHLAIGNNVPLERIAQFFSRLGRTLIIEFVPKSDSQVKRLLVIRKDVFTQYDQPEFELAFQRYFTIMEKREITDSQRTLYRMSLKG